MNSFIRSIEAVQTAGDGVSLLFVKYLSLLVIFPNFAGKG